MDSFRLYNFSPSVQAVTHKDPSKIHGVGGKTETTVLFFYKYGIMNPGLH